MRPYYHSNQSCHGHPWTPSASEPIFGLLIDNWLLWIPYERQHLVVSALLVWVARVYPEKCCQLTLKYASSTLDQPPSRMKQQNTRQFMDLRLRLHSLPPTCIHSFLFAALAFASLRYAFDTVEGYQRILDSLGRRKIGGGIFKPDSEKGLFWKWQHSENAWLGFIFDSGGPHWLFA